MKKRQLEIALSRLKRSPSPNIAFETYDLDPKVGSELLFIAEGKYGDISEKSIVDLGCGTGILAIGAALLGAKNVTGIDINKESVRTARENVRALEIDMDLITGDIEAVRGIFDTTVMNPPFGTRIRGYDILFLRKAIEVSRSIFSLHKRGEPNRKFLRYKVEGLGGYIEAIFEMEIEILHTYPFHEKKTHRVAVDLYHIVSHIG